MKRIRKPTWWLALSLRFRMSWTRWSLTRTTKALAKNQKKLQLMLVRVDLQHLYVKQLMERERVMTLMVQEMHESRLYHLKGQLPQITRSQESKYLDQALEL